ncbi:MAG TPA: hypothetical protein VJ579_04825 [Candidatus Paceibacterota bacterium]|nr:hypothetical protein [Candidatus Paceibacterota bacterium]
MDNPSLLLSGLRLNKALQVCAPEEHKALHRAIEKLLESAGLERPPGKEYVVTLTEILTTREITGSVRGMVTLDLALDGFFDALFKFTQNRSDISALCCAIGLYRSRINPRS